MDPEYLSQLIVQLYSATDSDISATLDEIADVGDPVLLYPVLHVYQSNKFPYNEFSFLYALSKSTSKQKVNVFKNLLSDITPSSSVLPEIINTLKQEQCFEETVVQKVKELFKEFKNNPETGAYDLSVILDFMKAAGELTSIEIDLRNLYSNNSYPIDSRKYALEKWLEANPSGNLQKIIDGYKSIKEDSALEKILAKIIIHWKGPLTEKLQGIIHEEGGLAAKNILNKYYENKAKEQEKESHKSQEGIKETFSNADLVESIVEIRKSINTKCTLNKFTETIFNQDESLLKQIKGPFTYNDLMASCSYLRDSIQNMNHEGLRDHDLAEEDILKLLPGVNKEDVNKSINLLEQFLYAKGIRLKKELQNLRRLNSLVGLIGAHPSVTKELSKVSEDLGVSDFIINEDWNGLHRALLHQYLMILNSLDDALKKVRK